MNTFSNSRDKTLHTEWCCKTVRKYESDLDRCVIFREKDAIIRIIMLELIFIKSNAWFVTCQGFLCQCKKVKYLCKNFCSSFFLYSFGKLWNVSKEKWQSYRSDFVTSRFPQQRTSLAKHFPLKCIQKIGFLKF